MHPPSEFRTALAHALQGPARHVERVSRGWRVAISNGCHVDAYARLVDEEWLELTAAAPPSPAGDDGDHRWQLLRLNARLNGCARVVLRPDGGLEIRGELFVADSADGPAFDTAPPADRDHIFTIDERVGAACVDLSSAYGSCRVLDPDAPSAIAEASDITPYETETLAQRCEQAGWHVGSRSPEGIDLVLDAGTASYRAHVGSDHASRLRVVVPLTDGREKSDASRMAIATILLGVGASVRTVKGVAFAHGRIEVAGIAAACERQPHAHATLDRALSALAVACGRVGREVAALQTDDLARAYLALRHPSVISDASLVNPDLVLEDTPCLQLP